MTGLVKRILELAAREQGYHSSDIPDVGTTLSCTMANKLVAQGRLFRVRLNHRRVVYFTDADRATNLDKGFNAMQFSTRPMNKVKAPDTPVVQPAEVQIQYGRRYEPRFVALSELAPLLKR